jgi:hypothetical protein
MQTQRPHVKVTSLSITESNKQPFFPNVPGHKSVPKPQVNRPHQHPESCFYLPLFLITNKMTWKLHKCFFHEFVTSAFDKMVNRPPHRMWRYHLLFLCVTREPPHTVYPVRRHMEFEPAPSMSELRPQTKVCEKSTAFLQQEPIIESHLHFNIIVNTVPDFFVCVCVWYWGLNPRPTPWAALPTLFLWWVFSR